MKINKLLLLTFISGSSLICLGQKSQIPNPALTADSLATGNSKDVLKSFFQLAFNRLISDDKELRFTSTPFAVLAQWDSSVLINDSYLKYKTLRKINFSFALKLDTNYKFNGFSSGVKYALINKRDETVSRQFVLLALNDSAIAESLLLVQNITLLISGITDTAQKRIYNIEVNDFYKGRKNFDQLDAGLQAMIKTAAASNTATKNLSKVLNANPAFNINKNTQAIYDDYKAKFHTRPLLTIALDDTTRKDKFFFSNVNLTMQYLQGITTPGRKNEIELDLKAAIQKTDDTRRQGYDLRNSKFSFEPSVNIVLKTKTTHYSYFEMKLGGGYYRTLSAPLAFEDREIITLNSTLRFHIFGDIWVPLEIKYEPKTGNLLGFLNVRANFKAVGKVGKVFSK